MKKLILFLSITMVITVTSYAQAPQAFKYQAIARDASGNTLADQAIVIKVNILQGSQDGPVVFSETHQIQTNSFGLINMGIGKGEIRAGNFSTINWGGNSHYVQIEMDPTGGTNYKFMGTAELLSVPYALYAESSGNSNRQGDTDWGINGNHVYTGVASDPSCKSGNVGIGESTPNAKLSVVMQYGFNSIFRRVNNDWASNSLFLMQRARGTIGSESTVQNGDRIGQIRFEGYHGAGGGQYGYPGIIICQVDAPISGTIVPGNLQFWTTNTSGSTAERVRINNSGNVGIGTTAPAVHFQVYGIARINPTSQPGRYVQIGSLGGNTYMTLKNTSAVTTTRIESSGDSYFNGGNVGISITNPSADLHVAGSIKMVDGNEADGHIMKSNAAGTGAWVHPATIAGIWSLNGTKIYYTGGFVGVGTTNPTTTFHVSGPAVIYPAGATNQRFTFFSDGNSRFDMFSNAAINTVRVHSFGNSWFNGGNVGIGTTSPTGKLHIWEYSTSAYQIMLEQDSTGGDAAIRMQADTASSTSDFTLGIDNDDDNNFEISNTSSLTGSGGTDYTDANTMMRINHARNAGVDGIIDFNHQSRARAYLSDSITLWCDASVWPFKPWRYDWYMRPWFPIPFNKKTPQNRPGFDEHSEFTLSSLPPPGTPPPWAFFTANEEGYYQVNARVEIIPDSLPAWYGGVEGWSYEGQYVREGMTKPYPSGYSVTKNENLRQILPPPYPVLLSIGIFVNDSLYAQGNNYQLNTLVGYGGGYPPEWVFNDYQEFMNAPNVSDVVYLDQDDYVEIYVMVTAVDKYLPPVVTYWFPYWVGIVGDNHGVFTFVSIHKVS